eukprot:3481855-Prymnesium_polylepis.1
MGCAVLGCPHAQLRVTQTIRAQTSNGQRVAASNKSQMHVASHVRARQLAGPVSYTHLRAHETLMNL